MTNWQTKKLGEMGKSIIGLTYSPKDISDDGIDVLRSSNVKNGRVDLSDIVRVKTRINQNIMLKSGDILVCARNGSRSLIGKNAYIDASVEGKTFGAFMCVFRTDRSRFVKYLFQTQEFKRQIERDLGPTINQVTTGNLNSFKFAFPDTKEQDRIVGVLGVWDEYIEKLEQKIALKEQLKKSLMQQLLTGKRRLPGFNDAWVETSLGQLYKITSSKRVFESDWTREGVPFYRAREIIKLRDNGHVDNELFISKVMFEKYKSKYGAIKENDILVTGVGTIGVAYRVRNFTNFYFKDGNIIWLKSQAKVSSTFIEHLFNSSIIKRQIHRLTPVTTVATYTIEMANATKVLLPAQDEQDAISAVLTKAGDDVTYLKQMKKLIMRQKKYLLKKLITGEIRTPEALVPEGVES